MQNFYHTIKPSSQFGLILLFSLFTLYGCSGGDSTTSTKKLPAPTNLSVSVGDTSITLSWNAVTDATGYHIYHAKQAFSGLSGGVSNYATLSGGTKLNNQTSPKTITGLTNYTKYYFVVTAIKGSTESVTSNEVTATPKAIVIAQSTTGVLNDTGITWGGNYSLGNQAGNTCSPTGFATGTKQDCHQGRDAKVVAGTLGKAANGGGQASFDFTKIGSTGQPLATQNATWSSSGNESAGTTWSCVKDNHTGLIWEVKTSANKSTTYKWGGLTALGRDSSDTTNKGTYYGKTADATKNIVADAKSWDDLITGTNSNSGLCGFTNWRVPTRDELQGIAHLGRINPAIDSHYFPNTVLAHYWSSSPYVGTNSKAWLVVFDYGYDNRNYRNGNDLVRLVRSSQ